VKGNLWLREPKGLSDLTNAQLFGRQQSPNDLKPNRLRQCKEKLNKLRPLVPVCIKIILYTSGEKLPPYLRLPEKAIAYSVAIKVSK
jgi:hypothetical protein